MLATIRTPRRTWSTATIKVNPRVAAERDAVVRRRRHQDLEVAPRARGNLAGDPVDGGRDDGTRRIESLDGHLKVVGHHDPAVVDVSMHCWLASVLTALPVECEEAGAVDHPEALGPRTRHRSEEGRHESEARQTRARPRHMFPSCPSGNRKHLPDGDAGQASRRGCAAHRVTVDASSPDFLPMPVSFPEI